jgi:hypothetical protein
MTVETRLPVEVELIYEVMPCNALRTAQEPGPIPHPCTYFREWGTYHSYDYVIAGAPAEPGIVQPTRYVGRAPLVPEVLSGCRKAPILAVGINPNLPGWWAATRRALNPVFDDYRQYAHYFRFRATTKLELDEADYEAYGGGPHDTPFSTFELDVPRDESGDRPITPRQAPQKMYEAYQSLLDALADGMHWTGSKLTVGEDLAYGNMVHCPSAKWTTVPAANDPTLPPMTLDQRDGIVDECFRTREYFLRQLFQSLPDVVLVFGQSTANAFINELAERFSVGAPKPGESVAELNQREIRLRYGLADGVPLEARVIFAPHITGNPAEFAPARAGVVAQLIAEATSGGLRFHKATGHLWRSAGACVFCPMLEISGCDYADELRPLALPPELAPEAADRAVRAPAAGERAVQISMRSGLPTRQPIRAAWAGTDEPVGVRDGEPVALGKGETGSTGRGPGRR